MTVTKEDLESFQRIAGERIRNGGSELSFEELVAQWQSACRREEVNDAIREGIEDIEAGRTEPFREASDEFRQKNNIPPRYA